MVITIHYCDIELMFQLLWYLVNYKFVSIKIFVSVLIFNQYCINKCDIELVLNDIKGC